MKLNIRFFTPAATSLFSVIASDVGRPLADLAHHFTDGQLLADAKQVLTDLTPVTRDIEAKSGASYSYRVLPYRTKDNQIEGVVVTFADVTARKQAEDVANAAMRSAQKANLEKSRFLAAASHDLRQPVQTLLQGLLAKKITDKDGANLVAKLEETLGAMTGILDLLLDINQLEGGFVRPEVIAFCIRDLLERVKSEFVYHASAKGLDLRVVMSRVRLRSDPRLLDQILRNLLANAIKYTNRGKVLVGCRRRGGKLRIEVWDTGIGIPPGQIKAIFGEFHQVDNAARERSRGLGLGLAIVERLSVLLGHTLDVRSWPGSGSVFTIEVPITREGQTVQLKIDRDSATTIPGLMGEILMIEDDPVERDMLKMLFEEEGHRTTAVSNSKAAVALVVRGAVLPDVTVADHNLPGSMTGTQLIARLRQALDREVPIVLTGDISTETLHVIRGAGCIHLAKPATAEELTCQIQNLLAAKWPQSTRKPGSPAVDGADGPKPTIFLVDDDRNLLNNLQKLLQEHGRIVEAYASASAFLEAKRRDRAGCVVIDAIMPGMGGIALLERLKVEDRGLPAIVITGQGDVAMAVQAMKAGAIDFIEKPFQPDQLLASIDHALERARESTELSAQRRHEAARRLARLTPREREVKNLVIQGQPNKIIAHVLGISQRTVESHRSRLMRCKCRPGHSSARSTRAN